MADSILTGYGKPSVLIPGFKGQIYVDQLTGDEYECKGERGFIRVDGDDQDNQFNWVLKKKEEPFYEEELTTFDWAGPFSIVRISSEVLNDFARHVPTDASLEEVLATKPIKVWLSGSSSSNVLLLKNSNDAYSGWSRGEIVIICVYKDGITVGEKYFPKSGTYVTYLPTDGTDYTSGIGYIDDESPRITWDGQTTKVKKLDEKFIPSRIIGIINSDLTFTADPSFDPSTMSVFDALASGKDLLYKTNSDSTTLKCIYWKPYDDGTAVKVGFHNLLSDEVIMLEWTTLDDGTVSIKALAIPPIVDAGPKIQ